MRRFVMRKPALKYCKLNLRPVEESSSGHPLMVADFSDFAREGSYRLSVPGTVIHPSFGWVVMSKTGRSTAPFGPCIYGAADARCTANLRAKHSVTKLCHTGRCLYGFRRRTRR